MHFLTVTHWLTHLQMENVTQIPKLTGFCYTSNEWLEDSKVGTEALLAQAFGEAIAFYADKAYISGTGAAEPQGVLKSACLISVAKASGQTADTVRAENFGLMDARLDPRSQNDAVWFINHEVKPFLFPVLLNAGTIAAQQPGETEDGLYILGHPVRVTEQLPKVGDVGDILSFSLSRNSAEALRNFVKNQGRDDLVVAQVNVELPPLGAEADRDVLYAATIHPSAVAPPAGLISWWTADNTAADLLGRRAVAGVSG